MKYRFPLLYYRNNTLTDPLTLQNWTLSEGGFAFFRKFIQDSIKKFNLEQKTFLIDMQKSGLIFEKSRNATWILTFKCSLNCTHCYQRLLSSEKPLNWEKTLNIFNKLLDWRIEHLFLSGGDIFLNPHLFKLLHYIEKNHSDLSVSLLTNGLILAQNSKAQIELLKFTKWKPYIQLSLYSHNPQIHDQITTQKGSHTKTLEAIRFLQKHEFPVLINVVLLKENFPDRSQILRFLEKELHLSREFINFDTLLYPYVGSDIKDVFSHSLDIHELETLLKEKEFQALPVKYLSFSKGCTALKEKIAISPQGDLFPCNMVQQKIGNLLQDSIVSLIKNHFSTKTPSDYLCISCPTKYCKKCLAFTKGGAFDKLYCQTILLMEKEVANRVTKLEAKGYQKLV